MVRKANQTTFLNRLLERTRRNNFLVALSLIIYVGYAVNSGQILIQLDDYRGIYNSAWVGSLMALVITFLLGLFGFFLVKNAIERDERTGVGQIIATTPLTRSQYLLGKWLSNFAVLTSLVVILALAALLMQVIHREDAQIEIWTLIAPFLFIALPMMALVAALAIFFESVSWLKGGFGNMVYFFLFIFMFVAGVRMSQAPGFDVTGISLIGSNMKMVAKETFPGYDGSFVLSMASRVSLATFVWPGIDWTIGLILQRLSWLVISVGVALLGSFYFNRFDPTSRIIPKPNHGAQPSESVLQQEDACSYTEKSEFVHLTPLARNNRFRANFFRLVWLECLLLVKGLKWNWLVGMAVFWIGCVASPSEGIRKYWFMLIAIWPVLVWSKMGEREVRHQAEQLIYHAAHPLVRLLASSWLAGVIVTAVMASGVLLGRFINAEPIALLPWTLSVLFIPTLALTLGIWSRSSKLFEVVYPTLWYLGPFNPQTQLANLDYLGIHSQAAINTSPLWVAGFIFLLILLAFIGRRQQMLSSRWFN
jgi:hypothetical protein